MPLQREIFVLATAEKVQMPCIKFFRYFTARRHSQCQGIGCNIEQMNMFAEFARRRRGFLFPFSECYFLLAPIFLSFIRDLTSCILLYHHFIAYFRPRMTLRIYLITRVQCTD